MTESASAERAVFVPFGVTIDLDFVPFLNALDAQLVAGAPAKRE
jgi:hypothetical protein